jgi:uncharacterized protein YlxW (UPF0749 family)
MLIAALVLGFLVSLHWSPGPSQLAPSLDQVERTMHRLELEQEELKLTVGRLRERLNARERTGAASTETLDDLRAQLILQKTRAGLMDVRGPGVQVVLDDSQRAALGNGDDLVIHDFDLRDVANVLWLAGAETIAVNGERIVSSTSIYCVGSTIMVNDTRLSPPYQISAIGDPAQMQDYLHNPGYLTELRARSARYGVRFEVIGAGTMTIPAFRGSMNLRSAQPGS